MISKYTITKNRLFFTLTFVVCVQYSFAHQLGLYGYGTDYRYFYSTRENMLVVTKIIDNLGFSKMAVFNELNYNFEFRSDTYRFIFQDSSKSHRLLVRDAWIPYYHHGKEANKICAAYLNERQNEMSHAWWSQYRQQNTRG